jgi:VWFA-related protein
MKPMPRTALLMAILLLGSLTVFSADNPEEPATTTFQETIEVRLMELEVFVSDRKGRAVRDLTEEDFTLSINRERVPITHFHAVDSGPAGQETPDSGGEQPVVITREPLQLVLYLDNRNLDPLSHSQIMPSLADFLLSRVAAGDRVMVVESGMDLNVRPFTSDPRQLADTLAGLTPGGTLFLERESERRDLLQEIAEAGSAEAVVGRIRIHAESLNSEIDFTIGALSQLIGTLAGVPGRKSLLYVSNGLPLNTAGELYSALEDKFQKSDTFRTESTRTMTMEGMNYDVSDGFESLVDLAGSARVAFYTFEAPGSRRGSGVSAETGGNSYYSALTDGSDRDLNSSLRMMAGETGGRFSGRTTGPEGIFSAIMADAGSYYSIGFKPLPGNDTDLARIDVDVRGRDRRVRHRKVFRPVSVDNSMADGLRAALSAGVAENPLQIEVTLGEARRRPEGDLLVPVEVRVPLDRLLLIPRDGVHEGHLRFWLAARTGRGVNSAVVQTPLPPPIRIPREILQQALNEDFSYRVNIALPPGIEHLAIGVRDDADSVNSFITTVIPAGDLPPVESDWG